MVRRTGAEAGLPILCLQCLFFERLRRKGWIFQSSETNEWNDALYLKRRTGVPEQFMDPRELVDGDLTGYKTRAEAEGRAAETNDLANPFTQEAPPRLKETIHRDHAAGRPWLSSRTLLLSLPRPFLSRCLPGR